MEIQVPSSPVPPSLNPEPKKSWLSSHMILGLVFLVVVAAAIVAGIYYWQTTSQIPPVAEFPVHRDATAGWETYEDTVYNFSLKYPSSATAEVKNDGLYNKFIDINNFGSPLVNGSIKKLTNDEFGIDIYIEGKDFENAIRCQTDVIDRTQLNIEGVTAYRGKTGLVGLAVGTQSALCLESPGRKIRIVVIEPDPEGRLANIILDSFKFINSSAGGNWDKFVYTDFGFEMAVPKNGRRDDFGPGFNLYANMETLTAYNNLVHVIFMNDLASANRCDDGMGTGAENVYSEENGWKIQRSARFFCAHNGVYAVAVRFSENYPEIQKYILNSITLERIKLSQPKYYLYCNDNERFGCDLYQDGKALITNLSGSNNPLLPNLGIYSNYSILGWDDNRIVIRGGAGDACFSHQVLYEISTATLKAKKLSEVSSSCPQTPEAQSEADFQARNYESVTAETIKTLKNLYPEIKI